MSITNLLQNYREQGPRVERVRYAPKIRSLRVEKNEPLTPGMRRITFSGDDLSDFRSLGFDDHVKLFVPTATGEIERRDYTPRRFDAAACTLVIDFAIHDAGPATMWALSAKTGDVIQVGGPKGSSFVSSDIRHWLLVGDETALPAIGRRIEEADAATQITSIVAVAGEDEEQIFETRAQVRTIWAHRSLSAAADPSALRAAIQTLDLSRGTFVWIAAEASVARAIRDQIVGERGHPRNWVKAGGYWIVGQADAHERIG